jgi:hypothetical protein
MADLAAMIEEAVKNDGLVKLMLRVNRYGPDERTPATWCAIAEYSTGDGRRGSAIVTRPVTALVRALEDGARKETPDEDIFA